MAHRSLLCVGQAVDVEDESIMHLSSEERNLFNMVKLQLSIATFLLCIMFYAPTSSAYNAMHVRGWDSGHNSTSCCPTGCTIEDCLQHAPQYWVDEMKSHGFSEMTYSDWLSTGPDLASNDDISWGVDQLSTDKPDALFVGLHGDVEKRFTHTKMTWRARTWGTRESNGNIGDKCYAWQDYMDFGDDIYGLMWMHLFSCLSMNFKLLTSAYASTYTQWDDAFDGIHSITGFSGELVFPSNDISTNFADDGFDNVKQAWLTNYINMNTWICPADGLTSNKTCPVWITYDDTEAHATYTMNYDDYTTPVGDPPGHGYNNIRLRAYYSSCNGCQAAK